MQSITDTMDKWETLSRLRDMLPFEVVRVNGIDYNVVSAKAIVESAEFERVVSKLDTSDCLHVTIVIGNQKIETELKRYSLLSKGSLLAPPDWIVKKVGYDENGGISLWAKIDVNASTIGHFYSITGYGDVRPDKMEKLRGEITNHEGRKFQIYCS